MNRWKRLLVLVVFYCGIPALGAAPYSLTTKEQDRTPYLTQTLVQQKPIYYAIKQGSPHMAKQITEAFTSWFANVTTRLDDTKRKELAPLLDVVFFAAQEQNYIPSNSQQHLSFYFRNTVSDVCGKTATGCFAGWAMDIYVSLSSDGNLPNRTLTHEIGHALQMNDLYKGEIPPESGYYSSQENLSIMNHSKALTCDDADAIINALYLAAQKVGRKLPDVHFTSFCKNGAVYHNGRMLNHPPVFYDHDGVRTLYTYCQDGRVREIWRISPRDPNHFVEQVQTPLDCPAAPGTLAQKSFVPPDTGDYEVRDFLTQRILQSRQGSPVGSNSTTYLTFPTGGFTLAVHQGDAFAPRYGYAVNEKGHVLYLFAFLASGYNFIYDGDFEDAHSGYTAALVYPRNNPQVFLAANGPREFNRFCQGTPAQCRALKKQQKEALAFFAKRYELPLKSVQNMQKVRYKEALRHAVRWEIFIRTRYPTLEMLSEPLPQ